MNPEDYLEGVIEQLYAEVQEARHWARRFYRGWEHNDSLLPDWLKENNEPTV